MGFPTPLDKSSDAVALQSIKELKDRYVSRETYHPLWGFCPGSLQPMVVESPEDPNGYAL
jgi:hypothetical protein